MYLVNAVDIEKAPNGIVLRDKYEVIWERQADGEGGSFWVSTGDSQIYDSEEVVEGLPVEILYLPGKDILKPRVYKDTEHATLPADFVWKCWDPESKITMQFRTRDDAMKVALMSKEDRAAMIAKDFEEMNFS